MSCRGRVCYNGYVDQTLCLSDGRTVGFVDYGAPADAAVLWCHGGPGSRLEPAFLQQDAIDNGLRIIGIDRPGYGLSTACPGRSIADWVSDALAVADHLGIESFVTVGVSTGGAYALATASIAPGRVLGVVACCSMTDMRDPVCRATMSVPHTHAVWNALDRPSAIAAAVESHGPHGELLLGGNIAAVLAPSDVELFQDPAWMSAAMDSFPAMFAQGLVGYADDRIADGCGWASFDVAAVQCPVVVLHGGSDRMVDVIHARHTAQLLRNARLVVFGDLGHFSIEQQIVPAVVALYNWRLL